MTRQRTPSGLVYDIDGQGPAVVLVHGWCCDRSYLQPQFDHLIGTSTVANLDLRGHGQSAPSPTGRYRIIDFADDVRAVASDAGLTTPVVVGHSMGGLVALELAAREFAFAAVMLDPPPLVDDSHRRVLAEWAHGTVDDDTGIFRREFVEGFFLPTDTLRDEIIDGIAGVDPDIAAPSMASMATYDAAASLDRVTVPILLVNSAGAQDVEPIRDYCEHLMSAQTVGSGHFITVEVPQQVNAMLDRFLALAYS